MAQRWMAALGGNQAELVGKANTFTASEVNSSRYHLQSLNEQSMENNNAHVFRPQPQFGIAYKDDGFISFQAQVMDLQSVVSGNLWCSLVTSHMTSWVI